MSPTVLRPADETEVCEAIAQAAAAQGRLMLMGGGSKSAVGRSVPAVDVLQMSAFTGVIDYDPPELVLTVGAATPLTTIERLLAGNNQMLAFAPYDPAPVFGHPTGVATIGGTLAAAVSGSQRLTRGAARDHLLGFKAVSGRGERFVAGSKVVKNVTGYDLPKLVCGSWGRLMALTEVTLKVLPRPPKSLTLVASGQSFAEACSTTARLLGSAVDVASCGYLPSGLTGGRALTAIQLQGFAPSVAARREMVSAWAADADFKVCDETDADAIWGMLKTLEGLNSHKPLWRVSLPAARAPAFVDELSVPPTDWVSDWAGGLIWMVSERSDTDIRQLAERLGGHAMLMRAPEDVRARVPALHPVAPGLAAIEQRVRRAFDPAGVFETGRF